MFKRIVGEDTTSIPDTVQSGCASKLQSFMIGGSRQPPECEDNPADPAFIDDHTSPTPTVTLCDEVFEFPTVDKSYETLVPPGPDAALGCDDQGDRPGPGMELFSSVILHEYMHFDALTILDEKPGKEIDDFVYGFFATQQFASNPDAIVNADSYALFALEKFWTVKCGRSFGPSDPPDDDDERCGGEVCQPDATTTATTSTLPTATTTASPLPSGCSVTTAQPGDTILTGTVTLCQSATALIS